MYRNSGKNKKVTKEQSVRYYKLRQMDKFLEWTFEVKGYLKWKDLVEQQELYNIKPS